MKYIFFAATPLHLMCTYELIKKNQVENFELILILLKNNEYANNQMFKTLLTLDINKYSLHYINPNPFVNFFGNILFINKLKKRNLSESLTITIIDFRNSFMHSLRLYFKDAKFILIDDGFQTYSAYKKYISKGFYLTYDRYSNISGYFLRWIYFKSQYKFLLRKKIDIFSIYFEDFHLRDDTNFIYNDLRYCKELISDHSSIDLESDEVYFIGTKLSEREAVLQSEEILFMQWLNKYWISHGKKMTYIAKRSSSIEKLDLLRKADISVVRFDLPLEIALMSQNNLPSIICSTGSTLLKTLPMLYSGIQYYLLDISSLYSDQADIEEANFTKDFLNNKNIKTLKITRESLK